MPFRERCSAELSPVNLWCQWMQHRIRAADPPRRSYRCRVLHALRRSVVTQSELVWDFGRVVYADSGFSKEKEFEVMTEELYGVSMRLGLRADDPQYTLARALVPAAPWSRC